MNEFQMRRMKRRSGNPTFCSFIGAVLAVTDYRVTAC